MIKPGQFGVDSTFRRSFVVSCVSGHKQISLWLDWSNPFWLGIAESSEIKEMFRWSHCGKVLIYLRS